MAVRAERVTHPRPDLRADGKPRRSGPRGGNPNLFKGMGYSNNPGGRRKYDKGAKERMGEVTPEVVEFWIATMRDKNEEMSHRMRASENIAWGFLGKPAQQVFAAHAHVDVSDDLPKNADEFEKAAALYAAMIGASDDAAGFFDRPILDVTPSRVLPAPDGHGDMEAAPAHA